MMRAALGPSLYTLLGSFVATESSLSPL